MADTAQPGSRLARTPRFHPGVGHDEGTHVSDTATAPAGKSASGLSGMLLPELKQLAQSLGITGASTMRKSALIEAISAKQSSNRSSSGGGRSSGRADKADKADKDRGEKKKSKKKMERKTKWERKWRRKRRGREEEEEEDEDEDEKR